MFFITIYFYFVVRFSRKVECLFDLSPDILLTMKHRRTVSEELPTAQATERWPRHHPNPNLAFHFLPKPRTRLLLQVTLK